MIDYDGFIRDCLSDEIDDLERSLDGVRFFLGMFFAYLDEDDDEEDE